MQEVLNQLRRIVDLPVIAPQRVIDWSKPLRLAASGGAVTLLAHNGPAEFPYVCLAASSQHIYCFNAQGVCKGLLPGVFDLENVPPVKHSRWLNVYNNTLGLGSCGLGYDSKAAADEGSDDGRIACVELTYTEGEGL